MGWPGSTIKLKTAGHDVEDIGFKDKEEKEHVSSLKFPVTNTARAWEAFAIGNKERYATLKTHWSFKSCWMLSELAACEYCTIFYTSLRKDCE